MLHTVPHANVDGLLGFWAVDQLHGADLLGTIRALARAEPSTATTPARQSPHYFDRAEVLGKQLAIIPLNGLLAKPANLPGITSTVEARNKIYAAAHNPGIHGILLRIDSPGGTIAGTATLANEVANTRRLKPVVAHIEDMGVSAAYWIASQANKVYASTATALVGSIGTMLAIELGRDLAVFTSGPFKSPGLDGKITTQQATYLQGLVDALQQPFTRAVMAGRGMSAEQVKAVATGAVWTAHQATRQGLIDAIHSPEKSAHMLARMEHPAERN